MSKISRSIRGLNQLPNALLLSMVATFDSQMSDIVRAMLKVKSERLRHGQRQVSLARIMNAGSLKEIIDEAITDEVYQFSRNSHDEQVQYIEEYFSISIRKDWKRWPDLIEIFETRNLVAHGEKAYTHRYVAICSKHDHKGSETQLGREIKVSSRYLRQSMNVLSEFAILTIFSLWRKHVPNEETKAFEALNEVVFDAIVSRRFALAVAIGEYALSLKNTSIKEANRLMFVVNLASAYFHLKNKESGNKVLDGVDWSATADNFKICVAALREDVGEVTRLLPMILASKSITMDSFRSWPVFSFIRNNQDFRESFETTFGDKFETKPEPKLLIEGTATTVATEEPGSDETKRETRH